MIALKGIVMSTVLKHNKLILWLLALLLIAVTIPVAVSTVVNKVSAATSKYLVVGQGWIANGTGTTNSTRRLVPGVNNINVTATGTFVVTMVVGTSAVAATDVCTVSSSPKSCTAGAATTVTTSGSTGNIKVTVTYNATGTFTSSYSWSASSGGVSGVGAPGTTSDIAVDSNSFSATGQAVNLSSGTCRVFDCSAVTNNPTFSAASSSSTFTTYGAITMATGITFTFNGTWYVEGTGTYNHNFAGLDMTAIKVLSFDTASTSTLTGNVNVYNTVSYNYGVLSVTKASLSFGSNTVTCAALTLTGTTTRTLNLNSSTVNIHGNFTVSGSGYTFDAGTSTINAYVNGNASGCTFAGAGQTFNTVNFSNPDAVTPASAPVTYSGNNTFTTFNVDRTNGLQLNPASGATITTTNFTCATVSTTVVTFSAAATWNIVKSGGSTVNLDYLDLAYSAASPASAWYAGTNSTNSGNNTGWYFGVPDAPTDVSATDGTDTNKVVVTWTKSTGATGYKVLRGAVNDSGTLGDVATYDDTASAAPTITPGTADATNGTNSSYVTCTLSGHSASNGTTESYTVYAHSPNGWSSASSANNGYRGTTTLTYQWQRSDADSDTAYNTNTGTANPYNDTDAPADGSKRYFRCVVSMTGAANQNSTGDEGWRSAGVDISNTPATKAFGFVAPATTYYAKGTAPNNPVVAGDCTFTITNNGGSSVNLSLSMTDWTGGNTWTLVGTTPSGDQIKATAYYQGENPASGLVLTNSNQSFYTGLAASGTLAWDFKILTGGSGSGATGTFDDNVQKSAVVTVTGS
jgi:hypothetical protein